MGTRPHPLTQENRTLLVRTVEEAGKIIAGYFGMPLERSVKSIDADFVTRADRESEAHILAVLEKTFPDIGILSEERGVTKKDSPYQFVLDPLDGTHTFGIGFPIFSISLALLDGDEAIFGIVHEPITCMTYVATRGEGTTRNGKPIRVSTTADLPHAVIAYSQGWKVRESSVEGVFHPLQDALDPYERILNMWAPASELAHIASGHIEAFIGNKNEVYDFVAGKLLVREAGGRITDLDGNIQTNDREAIFLASNGTALHGEILKRIRGIIAE